MTRSARRQRGSAVLEVVVLVPIMVMVAMLLLQLGVAAWTVSQTQQAAREAARANSLGDNASAAAQRALPGALGVKSMNVSATEVRLRVDVPRVSILPTFTVERHAAMPVTR